MRAFDVATFVAHGAAQLGIVGSDVIEEFAYSELYAPVDLDIGHCRISAAELRRLLHPTIPGAGAMFASPPNIRTSHGAISRRAVSRPNVSSSMEPWNWRPRLVCPAASSILCLRGEHLKDNGLVEVEVLAQVSARLIVNRAAFKTNAEVGRIVDAFRRAVDDQA